MGVVIYLILTALLRRARCPFDVDWCSHYPQGYFIPSCTTLLCCARLPFVFAWYSHSPQLYFILHELLFCILQDFILMLLDAYIAYKDTIFLHEQLFCADQDFLFYWLMLTFLTKKLYSFLNFGWIIEIVVTFYLREAAYSLVIDWCWSVEYSLKMFSPSFKDLGFLCE